MEELFGSRETVSTPKGDRKAKDVVAATAEETGAEPRVSRGRTAASSSNASNASSISVPKSLTPAPVAPITLVTDEVTISLHAMPLVLPPGPPIGGGGGGGVRGGDAVSSTAGSGMFTTQVSLEVVGGEVVADSTIEPTTTLAVAPSATPDSLKSPPSETTLMSCSSDASPPTNPVDKYVEKTDDSSRDGLLSDDMASMAIDSKGEKEFERRERKGAILEASQDGDGQKKTFSG